MFPLLVSFCNVGALFPEFSLCYIDSNRAVHFIRLEEIAARLYFTGITGLCHTSDGYAAMLQSYPSAVLLMNTNFSVRDIIRLDTVHDSHSLLADEGGLIIVSTGDNRLVRYDFASRSEQTLWTLNDVRFDSHHLNSIVRHKGRLCVSQFGEHSFRGLRSGSIVEVETGREILVGLREPHSLFSDDGSLYVLESLTGNLIALRDGVVVEGVERFDGYVRGLAVRGSAVLVGKSSHREKSRSFGDNRQNPQSVGASDLAKRSALYWAAGNVRGAIDLTNFGSEIYDVLPVEPTNSPHLVPAGRAAAYWRAREGGEAGEQGSVCLLLGRDAPVPMAEALRQLPDDSPPGRCLFKARSFANQGDLKTAVGLLERVQKKHRQARDVDLQLGIWLLQAGRVLEAIATLQGLTAYSPGFAAAYHALAQALEQAGDTAEAIRPAERAVTIKPNQLEYRLFFAQLLAKDRQDERAALEVQVVIGLAPRLAKAHFVLSRALARGNEPELALAAARRAVALDPAQAGWHIHLGVLLRRQNAIDAAIAEFRTALGLDANSIGAWRELSVTLANGGDLAAALEAAEAAFALDPENEQIASWMGTLRQRRSL